MTQGKHIGIVGLSEAGNLGDDLILIAVVDAIYATLPDAHISFVTYGQPLDWAGLRDVRGWRSTPHPIPFRPEIPGVRSNASCFSDCEVIVVGGGGLFQDSHSPVTPYQWLSYLPRRSRKPYVLGTGLGLGPLSARWQSRLRDLGDPFDELWVRDLDSIALANRIGWTAELCHDFIDDQFISTLITSERRAAKPKTLGVALRAWPGLRACDVAQLIRVALDEQSCERVEYFVLESFKGRGPDVDFTREVARLLDIPTDVWVYSDGNVSTFLDRMSTVSAAVSMKLHSSAIWRSARIPMYPIVYAPKVAAFFGLMYSKLELVPHVVKPIPDSGTGIRGADTIRLSLSRARGYQGRTRRIGFGLLSRWRYQLIGAAWVLRGRLGWRLKRRLMR